MLQMGDMYSRNMCYGETNLIGLISGATVFALSNFGQARMTFKQKVTHLNIVCSLI